MSSIQKIEVIDSHTAGEPTRVVIKGGPDLGAGDAKAQLEVFRGMHDPFRSAVVNEPRGSDVLVGALLIKSADPKCAAGIIFFNNVGYLGMCGHGMIGVVTTLAHLGRIEAGQHLIETPVGVVTATLHDDGSVSVVNVPSYRVAKDVAINVPGLGTIRGDVAWGGNWFYLVSEHGQSLASDNVAALTDFAWRIRVALNSAGYPQVDHVELFGPPDDRSSHSRNFVLCPGKAYDRSPCGTGTSAKLACLADDGKLAEGQAWVQEGILGTWFVAQYRRIGKQILPTITGSAYVTGESSLIVNSDDPFAWGIKANS